MTPESAFFFEPKSLLDPTASTMILAGASAQLDIPDRERESHEMPKWFHTISYLQKSEVLACFNLTECGFPIMFQGAGYSEALK